MRGQRLFIRPIEPSDRDLVCKFLQGYSRHSDLPAYGLLAKLVGELVAVIAIEITPDAVRIDDLVVAPELRRKRIGRAMIAEVALLAAKMDRARLVVADTAGADEFFRRVGFDHEGGVWIRSL